MDNLKIGTFNTKDYYGNMLYSGVDSKGNNHALSLAEYIVDKNIDMLGTQELVNGYIKRLENLLPEYQIVGKYRQGINYPISFANETNSILTKHKISLVKTSWLPFIPNSVSEIAKGVFDIMPRIVTQAVVEIPNKGKICMFNTHLANKIESVQIKQARALLDVIRKVKTNLPLILTGDFNMELENPIFSEFVSELSKLGMNRVPNTQPTYKNLVLDHMFLSKEFKIDDIEVGDKTLDGASDHKPVLVSAKIR